MKTLKIDRARWRNGDNGTGKSRLLNKDGFMCCLGFACKADGLEDHVIYEKWYPDDLMHPSLLDNGNILFTPKNFKDGSLNLRTQLITTNDSINLENSERETRLKELFKKLDIDLVFEGSYLPEENKEKDEG
jgi:hypothetical protein